MQRRPAGRAAPAPGRSDRGAGPGRPPHLVRRDPGARQTSASRRAARPRPRPADARHPSPARPGSARPRGEPGAHRLEALAGPLVGVGDDPRLARRARSQASNAAPSTSRVTGWPATTGASSGWPWRVSQAAEPSPWRSAARRVSAGRSLSTSWSRAAASTSRRSTGARGRQRARRASRRPRRPRAHGAAPRAGDRGTGGGRRRRPARGPSSTRWYRPASGAVPTDVAGCGRPAGSAVSPSRSRRARDGRLAAGRLALGRAAADRRPADRRRMPQRKPRRSRPTGRRPDRPAARHGPAALGVGAGHAPVERHDDRPVEVGPEHLGPAPASRSIVAGAGWPYGLPAPAETAAIRGRTASRNAPVDDVRLP